MIIYHGFEEHRFKGEGWIVESMTNRIVNQS